MINGCVILQRFRAYGAENAGPQDRSQFATGLKINLKSQIATSNHAHLI